MEDWNFTQGLY
jgi:hypothetical protein